MSKLSFIVLPDTQKVTRYYPEILRSCTTWIKNYAGTQQVSFVLHVGDIVDQGALEEQEFRIAEEAMSCIEESDIPLVIAPGNHDYDQPIVSTSGPIAAEHRRNLHMFNQYFGTYKVKDKPWFGGTFEPYKIENSYALLDVEESKILIVALEFMPRPTVLAWLDELVERYHGYELIIVTHSYMNIDGKRVHDNFKTNPKYKYEAVSDGLDGEELWQSHFKYYSKLRAVFSGHHLPINVSYRFDLGVHGNNVFQCMVNWQGEAHGGEGRLCLVQWDTVLRQMQMSVYNPHQASFEDKEEYSIVFSYE